MFGWQIATQSLLSCEKAIPITKHYGKSCNGLVQESITATIIATKEFRSSGVQRFLRLGFVPQPNLRL
jgi:hypothetical protein